MAGSITLDLSHRNPITDLLESNPLPDPEVIAEYLFNNGDLPSVDKNGFHWTIDGQTILVPSGQSESQLNFPMGGSTDPGIDSASEARFSYTAMGDLYLHLKIYIPPNYYHRHLMQLIIPAGGLSAWQPGDAVLAQDGVSGGTVAYVGVNTVSGDPNEGLPCVYLTDADNESGDGTWVTNITNVTRASVKTVSARTIPADNNKFLAIWSDTQNEAGDNDGYSSRGASPTLVFEMRPLAALNGGSTLYYHFGADRQVVGNLPNSTSDEITFITPADFGTHIDMVVRVKNASSESAEDGIIETYIKKSGEIVYTQVFNQVNCKIGPRAAAIPPFAKFGFGYVYGYWNMPPPTTLQLGLNEFTLSANQFLGVV